MIYPRFIPPDMSAQFVEGFPGVLEGVPMVRFNRRDPPTMRSILRGDPCAYCGAQAQTVDHIVPRFEAGVQRVETGWPNLTAACSACNARKANGPLLAFLLGAPERERVYRIGGAYFTSAQIEAMRRAVE